MDPLDNWHVTIDGHAYCAWVNARMTMKQVVYLKFNYDRVADGYRRVADECAVLPCQFQSVLWFTWKRMHNIVYQPQMHLFRQSDQWGLVMRPEDIRGFSESAKLF
jgi:hypothetical protein